MNKKYSYIGVAFVILLFGVYVVRNIESRFEKSDLHTFEKVPAFEFINQEGLKINNKTYAGKVYVVEFFFSTEGLYEDHLILLLPNQIFECKN